MTDEKKRFECYLNIQRGNGVKVNNAIISGTGETSAEARQLFDHALEAYREETK